MIGMICMRQASPLCAAMIGIALIGSAFADATLAQQSSENSTRWWKGNIHTHSLWSDGNDFPEMIADWYRSHGYHFLALSDHNILSEGTRWMKHDEIVKRGGKEAMEKYLKRFGDDWVETRGTPGTPEFEVRLQPLDRFRKLVEEPGRFLMIQGEEISDKAEGVPVHMNATNVAELIQPLGGRTVAEAIDNNLRAAEEQARRTGREILVHLNHPNFGWAITAEDIASVLRERFVEVYNGHNSVNHMGNKERASVEQIWDIANTIRLGQLGAPPLFGVGTDDSHNYHKPGGARPGRGWTWVRAASLEPEPLIQAMKAGDMYASSGVTLRDVRYDAGKKLLRVDIEPQEGVRYTTQFIGTKIDYDAASEPRVGKDGKPIRTTRKYSADVGQVFATVEGTSPTYQLTGKELYIRATITSSKPHPDPSIDDQHEQAWTQPVGWEERLGDETKRVSAAQ
jgi:predicted metal-dependent phosphoesterase TrpH